MTTSPADTPHFCVQCGTPLRGPFCYTCGAAARGPRTAAVGAAGVPPATVPRAARGPRLVLPALPALRANSLETALFAGAAVVIGFLVLAFPVLGLLLGLAAFVVLARRYGSPAS